MYDLISSFENQKILVKNNRRFLIIPLTDHYKTTSPVILRQAVNAICDTVDWKGGTPANLVVSEEERGGFIAASVALQRDLPFTLAKQNPAHIPGEIGIKFSMAYNNQMTLFINGLNKKHNIVLVDDIVDSGGTMIALIQTVRKAGVRIKDIVALAEKVEMHGVERIRKETGYNVKTIIRLDTTGIRSKVIGINI